MSRHPPFLIFILEAELAEIIQHSSTALTTHHIGWLNVYINSSLKNYLNLDNRSTFHLPTIVSDAWKYDPAEQEIACSEENEWYEVITFKWNSVFCYFFGDAKK